MNMKLFMLTFFVIVFSMNLKAQNQSNDSIEKKYLEIELESLLPKTTEKDTIFKICDQMPEFPGGNSSLMKYLASNLRYPDTGDDIQGRVVIRFVVRKDGSIDNIEILHSIHPIFDREAVKVIQEMPKWIPGKQNEKPVDVYFTLPIRFHLASYYEK